MANVTVKWLTTTDNPFDYFKEFEKWNAWDMTHGYNTCSYLARVANITTNLGPIEAIQEMNQIVEEAAELNATGNYRLISQDCEV